MDRQSMVGCDCVEASLLGDCTGFLGLPQQITTNLMAQNNKNLFSTSAADWSLKSICQQGCAPSKGSRSKPFLASSSFWCHRASLRLWLHSSKHYISDHKAFSPVSLQRTQLLDLGSSWILQDDL